LEVEDCGIVDVALFGVLAVCAHVCHVDSVAPAVMPAFEGAFHVFFVLSIVDCGDLFG
jgi:hypothetical protein